MGESLRPPSLPSTLGARKWKNPIQSTMLTAGWPASKINTAITSSTNRKHWPATSRKPTASRLSAARIATVDSSIIAAHLLVVIGRSAQMVPSCGTTTVTSTVTIASRQSPSPRLRPLPAVKHAKTMRLASTLPSTEPRLPVTPRRPLPFLIIPIRLPLLCFVVSYWNASNTPKNFYKLSQSCKVWRENESSTIVCGICAVLLKHRRGHLKKKNISIKLLKNMVGLVYLFLFWKLD